MRVEEEVGGERNIGTDGRFSFGVWVDIRDEVVGEEFVGVDEVVGREEEGYSWCW